MLSIYDNKTDGLLVFCLYHCAFDSYDGSTLDSFDYFDYALDDYDHQLSNLKQYATLDHLNSINNWIKQMNNMWTPVNTSIRSYIH